MRILGCGAAIEPNEVEQFKYLGLAFSPAADAMYVERFGDNCRHVHAGVKGCIGVLEHHLNVTPATSKVRSRE